MTNEYDLYKDEWILHIIDLINAELDDKQRSTRTGK